MKVDAVPLSKLTSPGQPHVYSLMEKKKQKHLHPELFLDMNWPTSLGDHELSTGRDHPWSFLQRNAEGEPEVQGTVP